LAETSARSRRSAQDVVDFESDIYFHMTQKLCPVESQFVQRPEGVSAEICNLGGKNDQTPYLEDGLSAEYCVSYDEFGDCGDGISYADAAKKYPGMMPLLGLGDADAAKLFEWDANSDNMLDSGEVSRAMKLAYGETPQPYIQMKLTMRMPNASSALGAFAKVVANNELDNFFRFSSKKNQALRGASAQFHGSEYARYTDNGTVAVEMDNVFGVVPGVDRGVFSTTTTTSATVSTVTVTTKTSTASTITAMEIIDASGNKIMVKADDPAAIEAIAAGTAKQIKEVSAEEVEQAAKALKEAGLDMDDFTADDKKKIMQTADADGNGIVSDTELAAIVTLNANANAEGSSLTAADLLAALAAMAAANNQQETKKEDNSMIIIIGAAVGGILIIIAVVILIVVLGRGGGDDRNGAYGKGATQIAFENPVYDMNDEPKGYDGHQVEEGAGLYDEPEMYSESTNAAENDVNLGGGYLDVAPDDDDDEDDDDDDDDEEEEVEEDLYGEAPDNDDDDDDDDDDDGDGDDDESESESESESDE